MIAKGKKNVLMPKIPGNVRKKDIKKEKNCENVV